LSEPVAFGADGSRSVSLYPHPGRNKNAAFKYELSNDGQIRQDLDSVRRELGAKRSAGFDPERLQRGLGQQKPSFFVNRKRCSHTLILPPGCLRCKLAGTSAMKRSLRVRLI
jgi:hypothetical protein